jgi:phospholipase/lecithinase/hemolysin
MRALSDSHEETKMASRVHLGKLLDAILLLALLLGGASPSHAEIYVLGDSLSDVGALGFTYTNPADTSPRRDGQVWPQYLGNSRSAYCNEAQQCPRSDRSFYYTRPGNNYAVGGAGITFDSPDARAHLNYTSLPNQVTALLNGHTLAAGDTVALWIGANDILNAVQKGNAVGAEVEFAIQVFRQETVRLAQHANGARIYILTIPDLGKTPAGLSSPDGGAQLTELTNRFNQGIAASLPARTYIIDSNAVFADLRKLMATSISFCRRPIDPQHECGNASNPVTPGLAPSAQVLFADPLHPSIAAHRYIANHLAF